MKAGTIILCVVAALLGHECGMSNVAKECQRNHQFTNGKLADGRLERYRCELDPVDDPKTELLKGNKI